MKNKKDMENSSKKIIYIVLFILLIAIFIVLLVFTRDSERIIDIIDFIKTDTKVLYVNNNDNKSYPIDLLKKYDIAYLEIDSSKLSVFEIKKLKEIINTKDINNSLIIYENGKIIDSLIQYKTEEDVDLFLKKNNIIPEKLVDNVSDIMNDAITILDSSYAMVYMPYIEMEQIKNQDKILNSIADKYSLKYKKIDTYLLSNTQKEKINSLLGLSSVEDQILILIKDNKMVANIRGIHSKNTFIETLYETNLINELEINIENIDYEEFENILKSSKKNIVLIGNSLKDSKLVFDLLNKMIYNYGIEVNYVNVDDDVDYNTNVKNYLEEIGYNGSFSLPLVIITESNNILDYAIGNSKEEYFLDIFIENGVIKGDVKNG